MKKINFIPLCLVICVNAVIAQTGPGNCVIKYSYDASGNRYKRNESCGGFQLKTAEIAITNEMKEETVPTNEEPDFNIAVLFPNPTSAHCVIALNKEVENGTLTVYNYQGRVMQYRRVSGLQFEVNLSGYPAGSYIVTVDALKNRASKTIIKN